MATGVPYGTTVSFTPQLISSPGHSAWTMTVTVGGSTAVGVYTITVTGTSGTIHNSATVVLTVLPLASFTVSLSPSSISIAQGNQAVLTITTSVVSGFNSPISLSASHIPSGSTISFAPQTIAVPGAGTSTMTVTVCSTTPLGVYSISLTDNGGGMNQATTVTLTVTPSPGESNFSVFLSPVSMNLIQGSQGNASIATAIFGGFSSSIALSAVDLPPGVAVTFSPSTIAAPGSGSSTVSVNAANSTMSRAYPIKIVATGGALQRTAAVVLMVNGPSTATAPHPTPPQLYVDTTWNPPSGTLWPAHDSNGFANALAASQPGDTIVLDAGTVYTGNFTPPAKNNPNGQWIYIVTSALASLPSAGNKGCPVRRHQHAQDRDAERRSGVLSGLWCQSFSIRWAGDLLALKLWMQPVE